MASAYADAALRSCRVHAVPSASGRCSSVPTPAALGQRSRRSAPARQVRLQASAQSEPQQEATQKPEAPWTIGLYLTKRTNRMEVGPLGEIPEETEDTLLPLPGWDAAGKQRLAAQIVASELGIDEAAVTKRLEELKILLPDLASRIGTMKTADLCRLAMRVPDVAAALVRLRNVFPSANVAKMCAIEPGLLQQDPKDVAAALERLRALMPNVDVEDIISVAPRVLNVEKTAAAIAELQRLMPGVDIPRMIYNDPDILLSVQKGDDLILYDNGTLAQINESLAGGPNAAPDGW